MFFKKCILTISAILAITALHAQTKGEITYKATNKTIPEILQGIENVCPYRFSYNSDIFDQNTSKTVSFNLTPIETCLNSVLGPSYAFSIIGSQIIITEKKTPSTTVKKQNETKKENIVTVYDTIPVYEHITIVDTLVEKIQVVDTLQRIRTVTLHRYETNFLHTGESSNTLTVNTGLLANAIRFYNGNTYGNELQKLHRPALSFDFQVNISFKRKQLITQTGLNLYNFRLENSFTTTSYIDDPQITYTDTVWHWIYKEIFTYYKFNESNDSVAITALDSTYTYTLLTHPKKIESYTEKLSTLSWHYASIPFGIGYHHNITNTFSIQPFFLVNAMILVSAKGEIPNSTFSNTYPLKDLLKPFNLSATLACNILYSIEKQYSVSIKPFVSCAPSIFKNENIGFQGLLTTFGMEWGISYTIPNGKY